MQTKADLVGAMKAAEAGCDKANSLADAKAMEVPAVG